MKSSNTLSLACAMLAAAAVGCSEDDSSVPPATERPDEVDSPAAPDSGSGTGSEQTLDAATDSGLVDAGFDDASHGDGGSGSPGGGQCVRAPSYDHLCAERNAPPVGYGCYAVDIPPECQQFYLLRCCPS